MDWRLAYVTELRSIWLDMKLALWVGKNISIFSRMHTDCMEFNEMIALFDSKCFNKEKEGINEANLAKS